MCELNMKMARSISYHDEVSFGTQRDVLNIVISEKIEKPEL